MWVFVIFILSDWFFFEETTRATTSLKIEILEDGLVFLIHTVFWNQRRESKSDSTTTFFYNHFLNYSNHSSSKEKEKPTWKSKQVSV